MLIKITCDRDWGLMEANREIKREKVREMMARGKKMSCFSSKARRVNTSTTSSLFSHSTCGALLHLLGLSDKKGLGQVVA